MNVMFLTILSLCSLVQRHLAYEKWLQHFKTDVCTKLYHRYKDITSSEEDKYDPLVHGRFYSQRSFWLEFIMLSCTPPPYLHLTFPHVAKGGVEVKYRLEEVMLSIMAFRGYFLLRAIFNYSVYTNPYSKKLCQNYGFHSSNSYAILCEMTYNPIRLIIWLFIGFVIFGAYLLRIYEQPYFYAIGKDDDLYLEMNSYGTAIWLVIITVTTVGYGDYSACTLPGRIVTILIALCGVVLMAVVVTTV